LPEYHHSSFNITTDSPQLQKAIAFYREFSNYSKGESDNAQENLLLESLETMISISDEVRRCNNRIIQKSIWDTFFFRMDGNSWRIRLIVLKMSVTLGDLSPKKLEVVFFQKTIFLPSFYVAYLV